MAEALRDADPKGDVRKPMPLLERVLSQEEIDNVFRNLREGPSDEASEAKAQPFDFRRPDRIAKEQLRALHMLHETFARNLASSLSAYLRAYVMVNLVSVEQISFQEFTLGLPSPTCIVSLGMQPFDNNAVLELNPSLVFPILEMLLGGIGKSSTKLDREITEIEQAILEGLFRVILQDLHTAWSAVSPIHFAIDSHETEPTLLQILAPNEAVVAVAIEIRIGDCSGMMNLGVPSIIIKMLRQKFDQQWSIRKTESTEEQQARNLRLIKLSDVQLDTRLQGPTLSVANLLKLDEGDVLTFDYPLDRPLDLVINGKLKFRGNLMSAGRKKALRVESLYDPLAL